MFQSSPAYKGGRFLLHPGSCTRPEEFQSSPAYKGGRFAELNAAFEVRQSFQSSPAYKGGRFLDHLVDAGVQKLVSILARL